MISKASRYVKSKVINIDGHATLSIYKRRNYPPNEADRFVTLTPPYEYRPDLVSFDVFGIPDFWWRILEANNMMDIMQFKAGKNIRVPFNILD